MLLKQLMERLELRKALLTDDVPVLDRHLQLVRLTDTAVEKHVMQTLEGSSISLRFHFPWKCASAHFIGNTVQ